MVDPSAGGRPDDGPRISSKRLLEALQTLKMQSLLGFGVAMGHPMGHREFGDDSRQPVGLANAMRLRWHA